MKSLYAVQGSVNTPPHKLYGVLYMCMCFSREDGHSFLCFFAIVFLSDFQRGP